MADTEGRPTSIGKRIVETRDTINRLHDAHEIFTAVLGRRMTDDAAGESGPSELQQLECDMALAHVREVEAELIRAILAREPAHVRKLRDGECPDDWRPRGVMVDGMTYTIFQDTRRDDEPEWCVAVDHRDYPDATTVWRLAIAPTDQLVDLDAAFR